MKLSKLSLWKSLLVGVLTLVSASAFASTADYVPGQVIVKYRTNSVRTRTTMNQLYSAVGVKHVKRLNGVMRGFEVLTIDSSIKIQDAIADLMRSNVVEYAQPNYILHIFPSENLNLPNPRATDPPGGGLPGAIPCIPGFNIPGCDPNAKIPCLIPGLPFPPGCDNGGGGNTPVPNPDPNNPAPPASRPALQDPPADVVPPVADPSLSQAYGLSKVDAIDAWKTFRGDKKFIVADIDTGIDYNHEDLAFNVWRNPNPTKNDIVGWDFIHNDGLPYDDNMHGTHTAGTIGAVGGNGIGVSGVTQRVSIMALKFLSGEGSGTTDGAIQAIDYAIEHGAKVLSNSWGGSGDDNNQALHDAIDRAKAKDVLFVAAAGNDGVDNDTDARRSYPAAFDNDNLISVAATDESDGLAFFSNYGVKTTQVAAPGVNVYSTVPGNQYKTESGTSMACPHIAGAAALIWSMKPSMTYKQVKDILMKSVDVVPSLQGKVATGGRINVMKAMQMVQSME